MDKVRFTNKFGVEQEEVGWLKFEYEIGWKFHSNEPKCFAGDILTNKKPSCEFWCGGDQCTINDPAYPNNDNNFRRNLQSTPPIAGRDIVRATYNGIDLKFVNLPGTPPATSATNLLSVPKALKIPTHTFLNTNHRVIPDRLLQLYLDDYRNAHNNVGLLKLNSLIQVDIEETTLKEAKPIALSAKFEESFEEPYKYILEDKIEIDKKPPAAIKITKVPKKGSMKMKTESAEKVLEVGDIVPAEEMDSYIYD
jgi:hypothetical protein